MRESLGRWTGRCDFINGSADAPTHWRIDDAKSDT